MNSILDQHDSEVRLQSFASMESDVRLVDALILQISRGTILLQGQSIDRGINFLANLLITQAFNSLWRAREDAVCGYPVQALTLCRAALETWATLIWVERHPHDTDKWLWAIVDEVEEPSERTPTFKAIWDELGDLGIIPKASYEVLSKFAHPRNTGLRYSMTFDESATTFLKGGHFDEKALRLCLFLIVQVAQPFLENVHRLQKRVLGTTNEKWLRDAGDLTKQSDDFVGRLVKELDLDSWES